MDFMKVMKKLLWNGLVSIRLAGNMLWWSSQLSSFTTNFIIKCGALVNIFAVSSTELYALTPVFAAMTSSICLLTSSMVSSPLKCTFTVVSSLLSLSIFLTAKLAVMSLCW